MFKRRLLILSAILIVMIMAVTASQVMADVICSTGACPDSCQAGPLVINAVDPFPRILTEPSSGYYCGLLSSDYPCKIWEWQIVSGDPTDISLADFLVPVCCTTQITIQASDPQIPPENIYEPCQFDTSTKWPTPPICDDYVVRMSSQIVNPAQNRFWIATNMEVEPGVTSFVFKLGNKVYPCINQSAYPVGDPTGLGGIAGPGCAPETIEIRPDGAVPVKHCLSLLDRVVEVDGSSVHETISANFERDYRGCIIFSTVKFYRTTDCSGTAYEGTPETPPTSFVYSSGTEGTSALCAEYIDVTSESPGKTCVGSGSSRTCFTW